MKFYLLFILLFTCVGCGPSGDTISETKKLLAKMSPLSAEEQSKSIAACETNPGWSGKIVSFQEIAIQVKCVKVQQ